MEPKKPSPPWLRVAMISLMAAALAGVITYGICFLVPKWYTVQSSLYFTVQGNSAASGLAAALSKGNSTADQAGTVPIANGIFNSPQVASSPLTANSILNSARCRRQVAMECGLQRAWHLTLPRTLDKLTKIATFDIDKGGLLQIGVTDRYPSRAAQISASYIRNLQEIATQLSTAASHRNRLILDGEVQASRASLAILRERLAAQQLRSSLAQAPSAASAAITQGYLDLLVRQKQAGAELRATEARIRQQTSASQAALRSGLRLPGQSPFASRQIANLRNLETQFAEAQKSLGPENPQYLSLKAQVDAARSQVQAEVSRENSSLQAGIAPEVASLYTLRVGQKTLYDSLTAQLQQAEKRVLQLPELQKQQAQLIGEVTIAEQRVAFLVSEDEKAHLAEERDAPTFLVVDEPLVPTEPAGPKKGLIAGLVSLGVLLASAAILLRPYYIQASAEGQD